MGPTVLNLPNAFRIALNDPYNIQEDQKDLVSYVNDVRTLSIYGCAEDLAHRIARLGARSQITIVCIHRVSHS